MFGFVSLGVSFASFMASDLDVSLDYLTGRSDYAKPLEVA